MSFVPISSCLVLMFNPFTAKFSQKQILTKFPNFMLWKLGKQMASCESRGRELSFEWSHRRILSTDWKVRVTLQNNLHQALWQWRVEKPCCLFEFHPRSASLIMCACLMKVYTWLYLMIAIELWGCTLRRKGIPMLWSIAVLWKKRSNCRIPGLPL